MKRGYLTGVGLLVSVVLLAGCSSGGSHKEIIMQTDAADSVEESSGSTEVTDGVEPDGSEGDGTGRQSGNSELTREETDWLCGQLRHTVTNCKDGSQIIVVSGFDNYFYIRYMPERLENGNYSFFRTFSAPCEVSRQEDGTVDIPICINDSEEVRFLMNVEYPFPEDSDHRTVKFTFVNQEDKEFDQMYGAFDSDAMTDYRMSLKPDTGMPDEELAAFLRACVYNGNLSVLDQLYRLTPEDETEERFELELAASMAAGNDLSISDENPYRSEIYYGESNRDFPQPETLEFVAESLQAGEGLEKRGARLVEPDGNWENIYQIPGFAKLYEYLHEDESVTAIYNYDLDHDNLPEVLVLFPGGSMGNYFWEVLHLDKSGKITGTNSGEGMGDASLYCYQGNYFFTSPIMDFTDKEFWGWEVHALDDRDQMYAADVYKEKVGTEIVFTDPYEDVERSYYAGWELDRYIDQYKAYETTAVGEKIEADEEIQNLFQEARYRLGTYGMIDFNNDGTDDWTNVYKFYTSTRYPYYCSYVFVDGKTEQVLDFSQLADLSYSLRCIVPYTLEDKNYFICVLNGHGNYVFKMIEIRGMEPVEVQNWFAVVRNRILVHASESHGVRIGV